MGNSKGRLFLIEIVIIILFFALASAACMNLFAQAKQTSEKSADLAAAVRQAQYAAEIFKGVGGDGDALARELDAPFADGRLVVYYDENWRPVSADSGRRLELVVDREEALQNAEITVFREEEELYGIQAAVLGEAS